MNRAATPASVNAAKALAEAVLGRERRPPAGAHVVLARCAEWFADAAAHERHVAAALAVDPTFDLAVEDAVMIANERGQAGRVVELLGRLADAGPYDGLITAEFARPGPMRRGRNESCGCGSGRKYKDCCSATNGYDLTLRLPWLVQKAWVYAKRERHFGVLWGLLEAVVGRSIGPDVTVEPDEEILMAMSCLNHFTVELAMVEGGLLERFVRERSSLLPVDEAALCAEWATRRHRLWRVESTFGDDMELVDVLSGEIVDVLVRDMARKRPVGSVFLAAVLPAPVAPYLWSAGLPVAAADLDAVASCVEGGPSAAELAAVALAPVVRAGIAHRDAAA